ncbi:MAG TPA: TMEM175 family protein [Thermomicrobiaceae bacterium]|nr:TMEM175 family protein [Thermomicrobiaceae bacterium]
MGMEHPRPLRKGLTSVPTTPEGLLRAGPPRLAALSDGVFAVAMTLLVLDLRVPDLPPNHAATALAHSLLALWPHYLTYALSFVVVGAFWMGHHQTLLLLRRIDRGFVWLNLLFLLCISAVPFVTAVYGRYGGEPVAAAVYAGFLLVTQLIQIALLVDATRHRRLVGEDLDPVWLADRMEGQLLVAAVFAVSFVVAWLSPLAALLTLSLVWVINALGRPIRLLRPHRRPRQPTPG